MNRLIVLSVAVGAVAAGLATAGPARAATFTFGPGTVAAAQGATNNVLEIDASGVTRVVPLSGVSYPTDVAFTPTGDLLVSGANSGNVVRVTPSGTQTTVASGLTGGPTSVVGDQAGDVFVSTQYDGTVREYPAGGGTPILLASGLNEPVGIQRDRAGNLYVVTHATSSATPGVLREISPDGSSDVVIATGLGTDLEDLTLLPDGTIYVFSGADNTISKVAAGSRAVSTVPHTGTTTPVDAVLAPDGSFFLSDISAGKIDRLPLAGGAAQVVTTASSPTGIDEFYGDTTPPVCTVNRHPDTTPASADAVLTDTGTGVSFVQVTSSSNATYTIDGQSVDSRSYAPTSTSVDVHTTRVDNSHKGVVNLTIVDLAGNVTTC